MPWLLVSLLLMALTVHTAAAEAAVWTFTGPRPTGPEITATSGRITALAVHPANADTVYLGSAGGGVWKTTDRGENWVALTDSEASLVVGAIAIAPSDPDTIYAGTGESNACAACFTGAGLLKSSDGGSTWKQLKGPFVDKLGRGARFAAVAVDPGNRDVVLAAVWFIGASGLPGIYRSADGGETWTPVLNVNQGSAVVFNPKDSQVAYAGIYGRGVYKSADGGQTWILVNGSEGFSLPEGSIARVDLALVPSEPDTLYVTLANGDQVGDGGSAGVFRTTDGASTWTRVTVPDYCRPQCGYATVLAVDPADPRVLFLGGKELYRSTDGGESWTTITRGDGPVVPHLAQHAISFAGSALYVGNDGGVYSAADRLAPRLTWANLNGTLAITQFNAAVSMSPADSGIAYGGTQGTGMQQMRSDLRWNTVDCEDGGAVLVDPSQPSTVIGSCQRTRLVRSTNGGKSWVPAVTGLTLSDRAPDIPALVGDGETTAYFGTFRVYRTGDQGRSWTPISTDLTDGSGVISAMSVAPGNRNAIYAGTNRGRVQVTENAANGKAVFWSERSSGLPPRGVRAITIEAADHYRAWLGVGGYSGDGDDAGHIFRTDSFGLNWTDVTGDLPNLPVNDLVLDPDVPGTLYAATFRGVFLTTDSGAHWASLGTGLPNAVVNGLTLHRTSRVLRAATYGRGVWEIALPSPTGQNALPAVISIDPDQLRNGDAAEMTVEGVGFLPGAVVTWTGKDRPTDYISPTQLKFRLDETETLAPAWAPVTVRNPGSAGTSNGVYLTISPIPQIRPGSVVEAAGYSLHNVAPGSLVALFGSDLSLDVAAADTPPLPFRFGATSVRIGNYDAPLMFVSPGKITFQVPWEVAGLEAAILQVRVGSVASAPLSIQFAETSPGIFSVDDTGTGQGVVTVGDDNTTAAPADSMPQARPAKRNEPISIFCTGLGRAVNQPATGAPSPIEPAAVPVVQPNVRIGDRTVPATFAALTPTIAGIYQVNLRIPDDAPTGDAVPVQLITGKAASNVVTIAIEP